jgi:hemoglobin/transferrin/lactoferrin receptor protein
MQKAIALVAALLGPIASHADADNDSSEASPPTTGLFSLEKLVVSATRTERPQFTTPAAIARLDQRDIRRIQPYGYQDLFEQLPGVNIFGGPRRIAEEPAIRGFADEQVAIRVDGARQNFNKAHGGRFFVDPALIESVEVLRGASSAVWGSGALGGAVIIRTSSGRDRTGGRDGLGLRTSLGYDDNGDQWRAAATAYGQHGSFDWLAGVVGRDVGEDLTDGQGDAILATQDEIRSGQLKLGFEPDLVQRFELSFERFENDGRNPPNANTVATATNLVDRTTEREQTRFSYRADDPENAWLDLSLTAYDNDVVTEEFRLTDQRVDFTDFQTRGIELVNSADIGSISGEPIRFTVGAEYYSDQQSGLRNGADRPQFPDAEVDYKALFAQAEIELPSGWSLIPGLRFDAFEYSNAGDFPSRDDNQTTPRLAVGWEPTGSTYFWAEYAEAFRAPSLTELFADGVHFVAPLGPGQVVINEFVPTPDLAPEHARQIQIGGRLRAESLFGSSLSLDLEATAWRSRVDDFVDQIVIFIAGDPVFNPMTQTLVFPGITTNRSVDARLEGAELSATLQHRRGYLRANATVVDGERRDTGEDLASVQPDRLTLGAGLYFLDRQLTVGGEVILSSSRDDLPEGALATPGYGKTDLFVGYVPTAGALSGFEFRLALDNVFDKDYRIHPNGIDQPGRAIRFSIASEFQWLAQ